MKNTVPPGPDRPLPQRVLLRGGTIHSPEEPFATAMLLEDGARGVAGLGQVRPTWRTPTRSMRSSSASAPWSPRRSWTRTST